MRVSLFDEYRLFVANLSYKFFKFDVIILNKGNLLFVKFIVPMGFILIFPKAIQAYDPVPGITHESKDKFFLRVLNLVVWTMAESKCVIVFEAVADGTF